MIRLIVRLFIAVISAAAGLLVAAVVLDGVHINVVSFIAAVVIFAVVFALMQPFLASQFRNASAAAMGGLALLSTLIALIVTDIASDGLTINGIGTWIFATVIVWVISLLAAFILPYLGLKRYLEKKRSE